MAIQVVLPPEASGEGPPGQRPCLWANNMQQFGGNGDDDDDDDDDEMK